MIEVAERGGATIVTAEVDGNFDRTGLPDPVIIDHCFAAEGGKIVGLTCRLAGLRAGSWSVGGISRDYSMPQSDGGFRLESTVEITGP